MPAEAGAAFDGTGDDPVTYPMAWESLSPVCPKCWSALLHPEVPRSSMPVPVRCCGEIIQAVFYREQRGPNKFYPVRLTPGGYGQA